MSSRTCASVSPRQSASSLIRWSISRAGDSAAPSAVLLFLAAMSRPLALVDANQGARGIPDRAIANTVRLFGRLLNHLDVAGLQPLEGRVEIGGRQGADGGGALC